MIFFKESAEYFYSFASLWSTSNIISRFFLFFFFSHLISKTPGCFLFFLVCFCFFALQLVKSICFHSAYRSYEKITYHWDLRGKTWTIQRMTVSKTQLSVIYHKYHKGMWRRGKWKLIHLIRTEVNCDSACEDHGVWMANPNHFYKFSGPNQVLVCCFHWASIKLTNFSRVQLQNYRISQSYWHPSWLVNMVTRGQC